MKKIYIALMILLVSQTNLVAKENLSLQHYAKDDGVELPFSVERGKDLWFRQGIQKEGKLRNCGSCHGDNHPLKGKHAKSGKVIEPMALSVNPERYTELKKIEKWFKRNCKWAWGRECTAQEKGDLLTYLLQQ